MKINSCSTTSSQYFREHNIWITLVPLWRPQFWASVMPKLLDDILVSLVLIPVARWITLLRRTLFPLTNLGILYYTFQLFFSVAWNGATSSLSDIRLKCKLFPNKENELCLLALTGLSPSAQLNSGGVPQSMRVPPLPTLLILSDCWISSISKSI